MNIFTGKKREQEEAARKPFLMPNNDHATWGWTDQIVLQAEKHYESKFVGYFGLKDSKSGLWTADAFPIFYNPEPDFDSGHSHYFALWRTPRGMFILDGSSAFSEAIWGVQADNGEVIYSRSRHDFQESQDGTAWIDGGRDYLRTSTAGAIGIHIAHGKITL